MPRNNYLWKACKKPSSKLFSLKWNWFCQWVLCEYCHFVNLLIWLWSEHLVWALWSMKLKVCVFEGVMWIEDFSSLDAVRTACTVLRRVRWLFLRGNNLTECWSFDDVTSLVHGRHPDDDARDADVLNIMVMQCERNWCNVHCTLMAASHLLVYNFHNSKVDFMRLQIRYGINRLKKSKEDYHQRLWGCTHAAPHHDGSHGWCCMVCGGSRCKVNTVIRLCSKVWPDLSWPCFPSELLDSDFNELWSYFDPIKRWTDSESFLSYQRLFQSTALVECTLKQSETDLFHPLTWFFSELLDSELLELWSYQIEDCFRVEPTLKQSDTDEIDPLTFRSDPVSWLVNAWDGGSTARTEVIQRIFLHPSPFSCR